MTMLDHLPFADRLRAGELLAGELEPLRDVPDLIVLALPRGGVPVAFQIAQALHAPLDVFVVRKLGLPHNPEYAVGAIASGGVLVMEPVAGRMVSAEQLQAIVRRETEELARRELLYRQGCRPLKLEGKSVLLVDDGVATGATLQAAVEAVRKLHPRMLAVAAPVGSVQAAQRLRPLVDLLVFGATPEPFDSVGQWYRQFPQCSDEEVRSLLTQAQRTPA
ncbi:MAG: phosphoribosyltransferase [Pseudomonadota bacterium]